MVKILIDDNFIQACMSLFQAKVGDANYVSWIDVDKSGTIDFRDYQWFIAHKGSTIDVPPDQLPVYKNSWTSHWRADPYWVNTTAGEAPPTDDQIRTAFSSALQQGIGAMVQSALDHGYTITLKSYNVSVTNKFLQSTNYRGFIQAQYQVSIDCRVLYDATIPAVASPLAGLIVIAIALAIIAMGVGFGVGGALFLYNINRPSVDEHTTGMKITNPSPNPVTVILPDGTKTVVPAGGTLDYTNYEKVEKPNDWGSLIGMAVVGAIGIVAAVYVIPLLAGSKGSKRGVKSRN